MKDLIRKNFNKFLEHGIDYFFNHILAISTFVAAAGIIVDLFYPHHKAEYETFVTTYLFHQRRIGSTK